MCKMYVFQNSSLLDAANRILMWFGNSARDSENCLNQNRKLTEKLPAACHTSDKTPHTQGLFGRKTNPLRKHITVMR